MPRPYHGQWLEVGFLLRGPMRRALIKGGYRFSEEKGLTTSVFEIKESSFVYTRLVRDLKRKGLVR